MAMARASTSSNATTANVIRMPDATASGIPGSYAPECIRFPSLFPRRSSRFPCSGTRGWMPTRPIAGCGSAFGKHVQSRALVDEAYA